MYALDKRYLALLPPVTFPSLCTCSPSSEWIGIQISLAYHFKDRFMPFHYGHDCHFKYMAGVKSTPHFRDGTLLTSNVSVGFLLTCVHPYCPLLINTCHTIFMTHPQRLNSLISWEDCI